MTERKAALLAAKVHRALDAKLITHQQAIRILDPISHLLSTTQFFKLGDLINYVRNNPELE